MITLLYLSRGVESGASATVNFFDSYKKFNAGCPHNLIILAKGWGEHSSREKLNKVAFEAGATIVDLPDDGFDWGAYIRYAPQVKDEWVCILNTYSVVAANNWLNLLRVASFNNHIGMIGATGSWEDNLTSGLYQPWNFKTAIMYSARYVHAYLLKLKKRKYFPVFPNKHLRSNVLYMKSSLFKEYCATQNIPNNKWDTLALECGVASISNFIQAKGFDICVVGANGRIYYPEEWVVSGTFRTPGQLNLLVHDNRTRLYDNSDKFLKRAIEKSTWGISLTK